ncbi:hypothetical protein LSUE1_G000773 [Lachnellula suecica]|uniref:Xylanolytic transcriptional activator regulatory domain-containing protein n=1 Tax=Lachnellula suecica TaxID=602035 RepID=A0A8T9CF76_9HELO|nr:hypothetical protein LSUE1_G000773 [Lachnellula suecica]
MSTLRNLASLSKKNTGLSWSMTYDPIFPIITKEERQAFQQDPVSQGILTMEEAQVAFDIFFSYCHPMAPFLCIQSQRSAAFVRQTSPALFLSVCAVGTRFWQTNNNQTNYQGLHENYRAIVTLLDSSMSRLLLQPCLSDVTLDNIRCLLLYIQWMPVETSAPGVSQTRYNDISAWSVLGLAIRYSLFLGLDRTALIPFSSQSINIPDREDVARLRVWVNILTCDCHLMLSTGLPASLDPEPVTKIGRSFATRKDATQPEDSRLAAVSELVAIIKRAAKSSGDPRVRVLDPLSLKKANAEFDDWEGSSCVLTDFGLQSLPKNIDAAVENCQHNQMPFTSLRWYRLAINSAGLGNILSRNKHRQEPMDLCLLQSLDISLLAAGQTIFALANETSTLTWPAQSQSLPAFPDEIFTIDMAALGRFRFAVDSSWITHSFAAVFLVLCYTRGVIDDELRILHLLSHCQPNVTIAPAPPRPASLFYRLISLASQIFDTICRSSATAHPAADYRSIINNVFSDRSQAEQTDPVDQNERMGDEMDALFELMFNGSSETNWQSELFKNDVVEITTC